MVKKKQSSYTVKVDDKGTEGLVSVLEESVKYYHDAILSIYDGFKNIEESYGKEGKRLIENLDYLLGVTVFWVEERIEKTAKERKNNFSDMYLLTESILSYLYIRLDSIIIDCCKVCEDIEERRVDDGRDPVDTGDICKFADVLESLKKEIKEQLETWLWVGK